MGVGLNSALGLVGTVSVAASKVGTAAGQAKDKDAAKKEPKVNAKDVEDIGMLLGNNLFSRNVLKKSNTTDTPISQANDGQLNLQMANKAMRNMQINQVVRKATRAKIKGGRK